MGLVGLLLIEVMAFTMFDPRVRVNLPARCIAIAPIEGGTRANVRLPIEDIFLDY